jgi:hypothetical protein
MTIRKRITLAITLPLLLSTPSLSFPVDSAAYQKRVDSLEREYRTLRGIIDDLNGKERDRKTELECWRVKDDTVKLKILKTLRDQGRTDLEDDDNVFVVASTVRKEITSTTPTPVIVPKQSVVNIKAGKYWYFDSPLPVPLDPNLETEILEKQKYEHDMISPHTIGYRDSKYYFQKWTILDEELKLRIEGAFNQLKMTIPTGADFVVIATPDKKMIADIQVGDVSLGKFYALTVLPPQLYDTILTKQYSYADNTPLFDMQDESAHRVSLSRSTIASKFSIDASLFGGEIRIGENWGVVGRVGDDELGYPFWSSGQAWMMISYKSVIRLGARLPVHGGLSDFTLGLRPRLINGSSGFGGEFEFSWDLLKPAWSNFSYGAIGGLFTTGSFKKRRQEYLTQDLSHLYSIPVVAQLYYACDYLFDSARQNITVHFGVSHHQVSLSKTSGAKIVTAGDTEKISSLLIMIEYQNQRFKWFKLGMQYSGLIMGTAWTEIFPGYIYVEVKYSAVVGRDPKPWEHKNYVYGTLGIHFSL